MSMDEFPGYIAMPKLYGAPAYARPAVAVAHTPRPINPDDLPIVAEMTEEDLQILALVPDTGGRVPGTSPSVAGGESASRDTGRSRPLSIRAVAAKLRRPHR